MKNRNAELMKTFKFQSGDNQRNNGRNRKYKPSIRQYRSRTPSRDRSRSDFRDKTRNYRNYLPARYDYGNNNRYRDNRPYRRNNQFMGNDRSRINSGFNSQRSYNRQNAMTFFQPKQNGQYRNNSNENDFRPNNLKRDYNGNKDRNAINAIQNKATYPRNKVNDEIELNKFLQLEM